MIWSDFLPFIIFSITWWLCFFSHVNANLTHKYEVQYLIQAIFLQTLTSNPWCLIYFSINQYYLMLSFCHILFSYDLMNEKALAKYPPILLTNTLWQQFFFTKKSSALVIWKWYNQGGLPLAYIYISGYTYSKRGSLVWKGKWLLMVNTILFQAHFRAHLVQRWALSSPFTSSKDNEFKGEVSMPSIYIKLGVIPSVRPSVTHGRIIDYMIKQI